MNGHSDAVQLSTLQKVFHANAGTPPYAHVQETIDAVLKQSSKSRSIENQADMLFDLRAQVTAAHVNSTLAINSYISQGNKPWLQAVGILLTAVGAGVVLAGAVMGVTPVIALALGGVIGVGGLATGITGGVINERAVAPRRREVNEVRNEAEVAYAQSLARVDRAIEKVAQKAEKSSNDMRHAFACVCYRHTGSAQFSSQYTSRTAIVFNAAM